MRSLGRHILQVVGEVVKAHIEILAQCKVTLEALSQHFAYPPQRSLPAYEHIRKPISSVLAPKEHEEGQETENVKRVKERKWAEAKDILVSQKGIHEFAGQGKLAKED